MLLLFAAVVAWGASVSIAEFNRRVRPEVPLYVFKLENYGHGSFQVEFLNEKINVVLPVERAIEYSGSDELRGYREQAAEFTESASRSVKDFVSDMLTKLSVSRGRW